MTFYKSKKAIATLLIAVMAGTASVALTGCSSSPASKPASSQSQEQKVTWTEKIDGKDRTYTLTKAPEHAVSMSFATTEMMLALDMGDHMAGTAFKEEEIYEPLQKAYEKVPVLAEKWPSYEKFMSVNPDFATGWEDSFTKRGIPADKISKVPLWVPESMLSTKADLETNFQDMLMLGKIFHVEDRAQKWVDDQRKQLVAIQDKIKDQDKVRVFVYDSDDGEPFTAFEGYTTNVLRLVGAENVMAGQGVDKTWAKASWESFVKANPDVIIIVDYSGSFRNDDDFQQKVEKLKNNPQLQTVSAIKNNRFVKVKLSEICPGVRTVAALERISDQIHSK